MMLQKVVECDFCCDEKIMSNVLLDKNPNQFDKIRFLEDKTHKTPGKIKPYKREIECTVVKMCLAAKIQSKKTAPLTLSRAV